MQLKSVLKVLRYMMGYYYNNPFWGFGMIIGFLCMVFFFFLIISAIRWAAGSPRHFYRDDDSALRILKERYAKGEIDKKEFEDKKKDIE